MLNVVGEKREFEASPELLAVWGISYTGPPLGGAFRFWEARVPAPIAPTHAVSTATTEGPFTLRIACAQRGTPRNPSPPKKPTRAPRRAARRGSIARAAA